jgi:hypothetical protein
LLVGCGQANDAGTVAPHDLGVDCASYGAGQCKRSASGVVACLAENGAACTPSAAPSASCSGDVATACVSGVMETLDCGQLTGMGTCNQEPLFPSWSLASVCHAKNGCDPKDAESCDTTGTTLTSCVRGSRYFFDCSSIGMKCSVVKTPDGDRAACAP